MSHSASQPVTLYFYKYRDNWLTTRNSMFILYLNISKNFLFWNIYFVEDLYCFNLKSIETRNHYRQSKINQWPVKSISTHTNEMCFDRDFGRYEISQSCILNGTYSFECEFCFFYIVIICNCLRRVLRKSRDIN